MKEKWQELLNGRGKEFRQQAITFCVVPAVQEDYFESKVRQVADPTASPGSHIMGIRNLYRPASPPLPYTKYIVVREMNFLHKKHEVFSSDCTPLQLSRSGPFHSASSHPKTETRSQISP